MKEGKLEHGSRKISGLGIKHIVLSLLELMFLFMLSYIVPKKDNLLVFGNGHGEFKANPKAQFLHINENYPKYTCVFFSDKPNVIKKLKKKGINALDRNSLKAKWYLLRAKYIFVDGGWRDVSREQFIGNFNVINLWHGDPIKKINYDDEESLFYKKGFFNYFVKKIFDFQYKRTLFFLTKNEFSKKHISSAFRTNKVKVLGYPLTDYYFKDNKIEKKRILEKIGVEKSKKTFLYAPTFRESNAKFEPFTNRFLDELNKWLFKNNYYFLIKTHPFADRLKVNNYSNIIDVTGKNEDITELLLIGDVLISDYSSVFFDFTLQEKPVIVYNFDEEEYKKKSRDIYFNLQDHLPGPFCKNEDELFNKMKIIDSIFNDNNDYIKKYKEYNRKFNKFMDGNSAERVCRELGL